MEKVKNELSLYIHIPFCVKKCSYCDFLSAPADEAAKEEYVRALIREIGAYCDSDEAGRPIRSVFIGGGTPSVLSAHQLLRIMNEIRRTFSLHNNTEISIEVNPGTVTEELGDILCKQIANRISIGLQSANDNELARIGRIHTYDDFLKTYDFLRKSGCHNINIDLMSALPGQSIESWLGSLHKVISLGPEHISAYSLILEEGTPLYALYHDVGSEGRTPGYNAETYVNTKQNRSSSAFERDWRLPDEEEDRKMYELTGLILAENGYERYEISNYARKGCECRHNITYWQRGDYLGFGLGASSCVNDIRWKNTESLHNYINSLHNHAGLRKEICRLSPQEQMEETMFLGLRMMRGVSLDDFAKKFDKRAEDVYHDVIERYVNLDLLRIRDGYLSLTAKGIDVSNTIFADFLLDRSQET